MHSFSIIIPVYKEKKIINDFIYHIKKRTVGIENEIIVVDGDKSGSTIHCIKDSSVIKLTSQKGRANQMNAGAFHAQKKTLFFLHADSLLPENTFLSIIRVLKDPLIQAGAFDLCINSDNCLLKIIEKTASLRSRITRIPYGDQGIFIRKKIFQKINGYSNLPIMEDIDLMQKLKRKKYKIKILNKKIQTSARRWHEQGIIFCSLRNIMISSLFY
ncbi:glycosyl transferase family 2 protein, partial [Candidatus Magnetomorum sp. HK-1]